MQVTLKLNEKQLRQVNNLMMNCNNKQDMFDHLMGIGLNAFHALHMSNSYTPKKYSYSIVPMYPEQQRKTYHCENGKVVLTEV